jgi:hypothetical protein
MISGLDPRGCPRSFCSMFGVKSQPVVVVMSWARQLGGKTCRPMLLPDILMVLRLWKMA